MSPKDKAEQLLELISGGQISTVTTLHRYQFAFDTPDILTGAVLHTPAVGDVILNAIFGITEAWDGATPFGNLGQFVGTNTGTFGNVDMTTADAPADFTGTGLLAQFNGNARAANVPWRVTSTDPIKVVVTQDGTNNGADPGSTHGQGLLYLYVAHFL